MKLLARLALLACSIGFATPGFALPGAPYVTFTPTDGCFPLAEHGHAAPIYVDAADYAGVVRAAGDLRDDVKRVTAIQPTVTHAVAPGTSMAVLIGTVGHSPVIDGLIRAGRVDVQPIRGQWESWIRQVIDHPLPGVDRAVVIAGSDKRGTIYGIYDLSEQIGVSPWYWWADVTPDHHDALYVNAGRFVQGPPTVKYRGIFLNDEAPDLTNWVREKFGDAAVRTDPPVPPGIANYGHEFYARIFEVLLRLRANYLWPAMWNNAFNEDDPENARLADEYGIVMGTSHQEPMLRAQKEWDRRYLKTTGPWNYAKNPDLLEQFWRKGVRRNNAYESIVTLGLRGANDTEMAPGGPAANRALLEHIVDRQRGILREEMNPDLTQVPQLWCLYKEVQDYYEAGMRVPDDVTLLWAEDNWGNIRRLPTLDERRRRGGAGVYYHFDYHGGPRSYQWINTNPLPKIWEQLSLAKQYGADRIWIVNVGHFKGYEVPTEFFLNYAWDTNRWNGDNLGEFLRRWATREFGPAHAAEIADVVAGYAKYNGRRKPELLSPTTYSLTNYDEAQRITTEFDALTAKAERLYRQMPAAKRDAFYELVLFPTKASGLVNQLYYSAGRNELYAAQHRASAPAMAANTHRLFHADLALMDTFNHDFAHGRWDHFMDQTHLGYTTWRDPPHNSLDAIKLVDTPAPAAAGLGVAVEESSAAWPGAEGEPRLPEFDSINQQRRWIDVFNRGTNPFEFHATSSAPWIKLSTGGGQLGPDKRLFVSIDWASVPAGVATGTVSISGAGAAVRVSVTARQVPEMSRTNVHGFVENAGVIAIEPEHATRNTAGRDGQWVRIGDYGRTLSGMRAEPLDWRGGEDPSAAKPDATPSGGRDALVAAKADATGASRPQNTQDHEHPDAAASDVGGVITARSAAPLSGVPSPRSLTDRAVLEYRLFTFTGGPIDVVAIASPTLNFMPDRGLRYAVSIDDEPPQVITLVPKGYQAQNGNADWEKTVADNARYSISHHTLDRPGYHTLKVWMVDPAVVLQKLVVNLGGLQPSYLGPPESLHRP